MISRFASFTHFLSSSQGAPSKAELELKAEQAARFVEDIWITLACLIGFVLLYRAFQSIVFLLSSPSSRNNQNNGENNETRIHVQLPSRRTSWRNLPKAIATAFRILLFRTTLWIGPEAVVSLCEFSLFVGYVALMLLFVFIDSESYALFLKTN